MQKSEKYFDFIEALNNGKVCVFETDTVVGIGCVINFNGQINSNIEKIFDIKKRSKDKPLPWLVSSKNMLDEYVSSYPRYSLDLIKNSWPGSTTLVFNVDKLTQEKYLVDSAEKESVAFRIPNVEDLISAIDYVSYPVACTSANISGKNPVKSVDDLSDEFLSLVDFVFTKKLKTNNSCQPSQIISCINDEPLVIRN